MDLCHREHLNQVDLLTPAERNISEKEYWANRRGQKKLEEQNRQMIKDGVNPRTTRFQTQKEFLRSSIEQASSAAHNQEEFQQLLLEKFKIKLKVSRGRYSYLHPERTKPVTGRKLGTRYEKEFLQQLFAENAKQLPPLQKETPENSVPAITDTEPFSILFIRSDLRLVTDLQECIKARENSAYAQKVKLINLKQMARTVAYIQEHGYHTREELEQDFSESGSLADSSRKALKAVEDQLTKVNEQIHYTGQYLACKAVYSQFRKAKNKGQFRMEHPTEIALYESARHFLKDHSSDGRLPSMKLLKTEKERLLKERQDAQSRYHYYKDWTKELKTVCSNVSAILEQTRSIHPDQKHMDL